MGIDIKLIIGAVSEKRLPVKNHLEFIRLAVDKGIFTPPFAVLTGSDVEKVHGYRQGEDISQKPILDHWDNEKKEWIYRQPNCKLVYLGNDLSFSLAKFEENYSKNTIKWEADSLLLKSLSLNPKDWDLNEYLNSIPNPRIISMKNSKMETITQDGSFVKIGPFHDILTTSLTNVFLGDPNQPNGPEGNFAVLMHTILGHLLHSNWGLVEGGDWVAL